MDIIPLIGYLIAPATGAVSWIASSRMRRNDAINRLQQTVDALVAKNADLTQMVINLRSENAALQQGQTEMKRELAEVRNENQRLERLLKQQHDKRP